MTQKLITLNGNDSSAPLFDDIQNKSDIVAGLIFWKQILELDPHLKWRDIIAPNDQLSGLFSNLWRKTKNLTGDVVSGYGKVISNVGDKVGDWGGSAIRLFTDKDVQDGISRGAMAYASGGQSEAANSMLSMFGSSTKNPVSEAGKQYKTMLSYGPGALDWTPPKWMIGAGIALVGGIGLIALVRK